MKFSRLTLSMAVLIRSERKKEKAGVIVLGLPRGGATVANQIAIALRWLSSS